MASPTRTRLDQYLQEQGRYPSRSRARDAVARGCVQVNGQVCLRHSQPVGPDDVIVIEDAAAAYVSRAALKLKEAIAQTGYSPAGRIALDIGASTGGFTQVLLEHGARQVLALDVGHDQLADGLRDDPRVRNIEGVNARDLTTDHLGGEAPQFLVSDVSFISLKLALPPALHLAAPGAQGIFLVKPQFEVGRELVAKGGIVRDEAAAKASAENLFNWLGSMDGWKGVQLMPSPITGGDGNREWLIAGMKRL
ncbi:MAG: TlyA family RNA methyltransferase [Rhizobiaceae bacterium]